MHARVQELFRQIKAFFYAICMLILASYNLQRIFSRGYHLTPEKRASFRPFERFGLVLETENRTAVQTVCVFVIGS